MEVEIEGLRLREQERRQLGDPGGEELFLVAALGAIGVIAGEGFLGENVETGERERLMGLKIIVNSALSKSFPCGHRPDAKLSPHVSHR
jgi:hypothetical protein